MIEGVIKLVRPIVTILFAVSIIYFTGIKIVPVEAFVVIATGAIIWWYKDHEAEKVRKELERALNGNNQPK